MKIRVIRNKEKLFIYYITNIMIYICVGFKIKIIQYHYSEFSGSKFLFFFFVASVDF